MRRGLTSSLAISASLIGGGCVPDQMATPTPGEAVTTTTVIGGEITTTTLAPVTAEVSGCTYQIQNGDTLSGIVTNYVEQGDLTALQQENGISNPNVITAGIILDVCLGNGINDVTGQSRSVSANNSHTSPEPADNPTPATTLPSVPTTIAAPTPTEAPVVAPAPTETPVATPAPTTVAPAPAEYSISDLQNRLNGMLTPYGFMPLEVDGHFGARSRQAACAGRLLTGLTISRADVTPEDMNILMNAESISLPYGSPNMQSLSQAARWILVDQTCQVLVAGEAGGTIKYIMPVSTGEAANPTRNVYNEAFRYDPAVSNNGWHDSTQYPVGPDNPLNGNMYKPIYFSDGQAIHGSMNVPPQPGSKGCVRMVVANQDALVSWLGLDKYNEEVWNLTDRENIYVLTQGNYSS